MVKSAPGLRFLPRDITALRRWRPKRRGQTGGRRAEFAGLVFKLGVTVEMTGTTANSFPNIRMRRMRRDEFSRRLMRETRLRADAVIYPMFVVEGRGERTPCAARPGGGRRPVADAFRD